MSQPKVACNVYLELKEYNTSFGFFQSTADFQEPRGKIHLVSGSLWLLLHTED